MSKGDLKAVQGDGGWNTPDMVTKRYAHILDEDRRKLATDMEATFYQKMKVEEKKMEEKNDAPSVNDLLALFKNDPELLIKIVQSIQPANQT